MSTISEVMLVDDHPVVRQGLCRLLDAEPDLKVSCQADSLETALQCARRNKPDVAVVDLALRDSSGLDLIARLRDEWPRMPILVLSMYHDQFYAERALRAGVKGFLSKSVPAQEVIDAVRKVLRGEMSFGDHISGKLISAFVGAKGRPVTSLQKLSEREQQVFKMIGEGRSTKIIAEQLGLSVKTIETYRAKIKQKLDVPDAKMLLQRAVQSLHFINKEEPVQS